jgi:hypothetical protein
VSLPENFVRGQPCAICGADGLQVMHVQGLPDFVQCAACRAAFVADAGSSLVMYGSIPEAYPNARRRALRQWTTPASAEAAAKSDRPHASPDSRSGLGVPLHAQADISPSEIPLTSGVPLPDEPEPPARMVESVALSSEPAPAPHKRAWYERDEEPEEEAEEAAWPLPSVDQGPAAEDSLRSLLRAGGPMDDLYQLSPLAQDEAPLDEAEEEIEDAGAEEVPPLMAARLAQAAAQTGSASPSPMRSADLRAAAGPPPPAWSRPSALPAAEPEAAPLPAVEPVVLNEPIPGERHRAVLRGEQVVFPLATCAHCGASPARQRLTVIGSRPDGQAVGKRRRTAYQLPLCRNCHRRATTRSEEEKSARLQAHLVSALFALILLVIALALRVVNPASGLEIAGFLILIVLVLGYTMPALLLLGRMNRYAPPPDADYVRTTLMVPETAQGLETAFEWRNGDYARLFADANRESLLGSVARIKDRTLSG